MNRVSRRGHHRPWPGCTPLRADRRRVAVVEHIPRVIDHHAGELDETRPRIGGQTVVIHGLVFPHACDWREDVGEGGARQTYTQGQQTSYQAARAVSRDRENCRLMDATSTSNRDDETQPLAAISLHRAPGSHRPKETVLRKNLFVLSAILLAGRRVSSGVAGDSRNTGGRHDNVRDRRGPPHAADRPARWLPGKGLCMSWRYVGEVAALSLMGLCGCTGSTNATSSTPPGR